MLSVLSRCYIQINSDFDTDYTFTYLTTVGFGDITADTVSQRIFMIFGLSIGSFTTTYFMSTIINLVVTKNQEKVKKRMLVNRVEEYILYRRLPDDLQRHIREYVRLVNSNTCTDEREILRALSPELRKRCSEYSYGNFLRRVPYLSCSSIAHFSYFIEELALCMRQVYFAQDDLVAKKNDFDDECCFIELGSVKIFQHVADEDKLYKVLEVGHFFGETALLSNRFVIDYYVRAISWTGLVTLSHDDFVRVVSLFPVIRRCIRKWLENHRDQHLTHSTVAYRAVLDEMTTDDMSDDEDNTLDPPLIPVEEEELDADENDQSQDSDVDSTNMNSKATQTD